MGQLSCCCYCCCCCRLGLCVLAATIRAHLATIACQRPPSHYSPSLILPPLSLILIYGLLIAKKGYQRPLSANWLLFLPLTLSLPPCLLHSRKLIFPGNFTHCELRRRWPVANAPLTTLTAAQTTAKGEGEWVEMGRGRGQLGMGTASAVDSMRRQPIRCVSPLARRWQPPQMLHSTHHGQRTVGQKD